MQQADVNPLIPVFALVNGKKRKIGVIWDESTEDGAYWCFENEASGYSLGGMDSRKIAEEELTEDYFMSRDAARSKINKLKTRYHLK